MSSTAGFETAFDHGNAIAACARQDTGAFRQLYDREAPSMIGVALRIVRRRDLAEDVVHDAFVQIWRKAHLFDAGLGSGRGWMYAILRNRALNMVRDRSREDLVDGADLDMLVETGDHDDVVARLPERDALRVCLERLDASRRASVVLAYAGGLSHGEIAGRLGVPLGTVKAWIRRSLSTLRQCMA
ncbi:sigma-70 family RNA polymerase sigma factor [Terrihabitans sp. B22-R8]|uniref:sigma-70 family RNA polymerase sigma factor n=1 Tax=Terrihabitans sp. B22-R8 TaxID=3425128 RepID=UPI00403C5B4A